MKQSRWIVAGACAFALLGRVAHAQSQHGTQGGGSTRGAPLTLGDY
jgi:hypothetical protein